MTVEIPTQRYKHYNISIAGKYTEVLNVYNRTIFTGTEAKCKKWIDKEWAKTQDVILHKGIEAHYTGKNSYNISKDGSKLGEIKVETTKQRVPDYSAIYKHEFKNISKHQLTVTVMVSYNQSVTLKDVFNEYKQVKTGIKKMMVNLESGSLGVYVTSQLEIEAKAKGFSELSIMDCFDSDRLVNAKNLLNMMSEGK